LPASGVPLTTDLGEPRRQTTTRKKPVFVERIACNIVARQPKCNLLEMSNK